MRDKEHDRQIILDTNIFISALIKDSLTRKLLLEYEGHFLFPEYIFLEIEKHHSEILEKTGLTKEELSKLMNTLLKKVLIVPTKALEPYKREAISIMKDIDINDALFIACALAYKNSIIWSDDRKLKSQNIIMILNTKEIKASN